MKVLIWFGCFFVATLLNTILGVFLGVRAGAVLLYFIAFYPAKKLCDKWDRHTREKARQKPPVPSAEAVTVAEKRPVFCRRCGARLLHGGRFCHKCGTEMITE